VGTSLEEHAILHGALVTNHSLCAKDRHRYRHAAMLASAQKNETLSSLDEMKMKTVMALMLPTLMDC
jgi:hypothetical protein